MQAQRFPWKQKNLKTGKEEFKLVQGALRPIQFWEYAFPEESLNDVLGGLQIKGPIDRPEIKSISWMMRKMLKLDQIPESKEIEVTGYTPKGKVDGKGIPAIPVHNMLAEGVAIYPIGIKKDSKGPIKFKLGDGSEAEYDQEHI